ncbi:VOC family protein [Caulobacter segnis]
MRAKRFYEQVFDWTFDPWGPPDFYQIKNAGRGLLGALQGRRGLKPGVRMAGYEVSLGVEDLKATLARVEANGGRILMLALPHRGRGRSGYFEDTEGNLVGHAIRAGFLRAVTTADGFDVRSPGHGPAPRRALEAAAASFPARLASSPPRRAMRVSTDAESADPGEPGDLAPGSKVEHRIDIHGRGGHAHPLPGS